MSRKAGSNGASNGGYSLNPEAVAHVMLGTANDHACPVGGVEDYTDEGRTPDWNATREGTTENNGLYSGGILDAERP
jgi:hypothetical protein